MSINGILSVLILQGILLTVGLSHLPKAMAALPQNEVPTKDTSTKQHREQSILDIEKLLEKRLFQQAAQQTLKQLREYDDSYSGKDLRLYYTALLRLGDLDQSTNLDTILQEQMKLHGDNPHFLKEVAQMYQNACHTFQLENGVYTRSSSPWDGEYSGADRDRVNALRCLCKAMKLAEQRQDKKLLGQLRYTTAKMLQSSQPSYGVKNKYQSYAALGNLTDLSKLPDFVLRANASRFRNVATLPVSINPQTKASEVIFYHTPASWNAAKNDGERMQWLLSAAIQANPELKDQVHLSTAVWSCNLFSYSNTDAEQKDVYGPGNAGMVANINPSELKQNQTVIKTDRTTKEQFNIITLPTDYDFIRIASLVSPKTQPEYYYQANILIANEFLARNQRPAAVDTLKKALQTLTTQTDKKQDAKNYQHIEKALKEKIADITEPNGTFDLDKRTLLAGNQVSVSFLYRNATEAQITARPINMRRWQEDRMSKLLNASKTDKSLRNQLFSFRRNFIKNLLHDSSYSCYLGEKITGQTISLPSGNDHLNHIAQIPIPSNKPGWYLLTVTLNNGYQFHRLLTLTDMVLTRRSVSEGNLWFLADATTGAPIKGATLRFIRYQQRKTLKKREITGVTDNNGIMIEKLPPNNSDEGNYDGFIGLVIKGNSYILPTSEWNSGETLLEPNGKASESRSCLFLTSQTVYRPAQTAHLKGIIFCSDFATPNTKNCAGKKLTLSIIAPNGDKSVFPEQTVTTDSTGGFELDLLIPAEAPLGQYQALLRPTDTNDPDLKLNRRYTNLFRVEEYKKPEYIVTMKAPDKPIRLGQSIPISIQADYYAGGPLHEGNATITITRTLGAHIWTPVWKWDWLYDSSANPYHVLFSSMDSPLTVLKKTVPLDKNGKASLELPTNQDAMDFPSHHITYNISVSVTDSSLREVSASGQVIATCRPFNIFTSLNRGFVPVGSLIQASITAATADGTKISNAKGTCSLQLINADGSKNTLETWDITTNKEGAATFTFRTNTSGLHAFFTTLSDEHGNKVEESFQFLSYGEGTQNSFKINPLSITPDKKEYEPGDTAKLLISSDYPDAHVWIFFRNYWENESRQLLSLTQQTAIAECLLNKEDMPNMGVSAFTVRNGELYTASTDLLIPPTEQILTPHITPDKPQYAPREQGNLTIQIKDTNGNPVTNSIITLAVYDQALEYISQPNISNISKAIWGRLNDTQNSSPKVLTTTLFQQTTTHDQPIFRPLYHPNGIIPQDFGNNFMMEGSACGAVTARPVLASMGAPKANRERFAGGKSYMATEDEIASSDQAAPETPETSAAVTMRTKFADCIKWCGSLQTDASGNVTIPVEMPDTLTTWKATAWVITPGLQVGQASASFLTTKEFILSLQAPRFFVEQDLVLLSALLRNNTDTPIHSRVSITLKNGCLTLLPSNDPSVKTLAADTNNNAIREVDVPAHGQAVINWWATAVQEGEATIAMEATSPSAGDAMQMSFPVLVHGMRQLHSASAMILPDEKEQTIPITLPQQRRREESELLIRVSPSIALSMADALPYLAEYPYGCVEQTLNRFLPALIVTDTLTQLGLRPGEALRNHSNLNPQLIKDKTFYANVMKKLKCNPIYDETTLKQLAAKGIASLRKQQLDDGSWGWFGGAYEGDPVMTAQIVHGLKIASSFVNVPDATLSQSVRWLKNYQSKQLKLLETGDKYKQLEKLPDGPEKKKAIRKLGNYRLTTSATDVMVYAVLAENGITNRPMERYLFRDRLSLPMISQIQLAEILLDSHRMKDFNSLLPIISQFLKQDDSLQTAWLNLPNERYWWRWYGSQTATQAAYLKLMAKCDPHNPITARLAKWLLNNRTNGSHWDSTKTTASALEALSVYLLQTGEGLETMEAEILYDGVPVKTITSTKDTLFTFDNSFRMHGKDLTNGTHNITIRRKKGKSNIYANSSLSFFTLENSIPAMGNALTVKRAYYIIRENTVKNNDEKDTQTDAGALIAQGHNQTTRILLKEGDIIASGDIIEAELIIKTKNDVEYIMLKDPKPAGCEALGTNSGYTHLGSVSGYKELGDEEIRLFLSSLPMGEYRLYHRLRAERPGRFSAMPSVIEAMYAPELRGNSHDQKISISMPKQSY